MAYQMAATAVTLNDLEGHSPVAGLSKYTCAAFYIVSTDTHGLSALAKLLISHVTTA